MQESSILWPKLIKLETTKVLFQEPSFPSSEFISRLVPSSAVGWTEARLGVAIELELAVILQASTSQTKITKVLPLCIHYQIYLVYCILCILTIL